MYEYKCELIKVVDGDTIDLNVSLGFDTYTKQRFRLYGINAPETRTRDLEEKARGNESKQFLINHLFNKELTIQTMKDKKGKFGRWLGIIYADGVDLNAAMVSRGLAELYMI